MKVTIKLSTIYVVKVIRLIILLTFIFILTKLEFGFYKSHIYGLFKSANSHLIQWEEFFIIQFPTNLGKCLVYDCVKYDFVIHQNFYQLNCTKREKTYWQVKMKFVWLPLKCTYFTKNLWILKFSKKDVFHLNWNGTETDIIRIKTLMW